MAQATDISGQFSLGSAGDQQAFEARAGQLATESITEFKKVSRTYSLINMSFCALFFVELVAFLVFFPFFAKSAVLAFSLASLFLTGFSYFVLMFYYQAKKPEQFYQLREDFAGACLKEIAKELPESHLLLAYAAKLLYSRLIGKEAEFYPLFSRFPTFSLLMQKFSLWAHWRDVHQMKEVMLFLAVNEKVQWIKLHPTDLEAHAALAETYTQLYKLYQHPMKRGEEWVWVPPSYSSDEMRKKFKLSAERAIEELTILDDYSPNDAWVQAQLASVYHDLELPELEIQAYEKILRCLPNDRQVLLRLGILYFEHGRTAKGLRLYEQLKKAKDAKAEELIAYYDAALTYD